MAERPISNPKDDWLEIQQDRRRTLQSELEALDLKQSDVALAGNVRGLISELRTINNAIEDFNKIFKE